VGELEANNGVVLLVTPVIMKPVFHVRSVIPLLAGLYPTAYFLF